MLRREFFGLLALGCGDDMAKYPDTLNKFPGTPKAYPASPKAYPGTINGYPNSNVATPPDLRLLGLGVKLQAYWDIRPAVSGATASITLSSTLQSQGTTPPTVTVSGSLSVLRHAVCTYTLGGAIGTMKYLIVYDSGTGLTWTSGTSSDTGGGNCTVSIGGGNSIVFGAGTYNVDNTHAIQCTSWAELTGLANATLTDVLSGVGFRYEAFGMNGQPCLRAVKNPSALSNTTGIPALATGTDTHFEVHILGKGAKHISGTGAGVMWGFSLSTAGHTTKSFIRKVSTGPTNANASRWLLRRRDSSGAPADADVVSDGNSYAHLDAGVFSDLVATAGQMHFGGNPCRSSAASTDRGTATTLDRFSLGNLNLSTTGFATTLQWLGKYSALAITAPLTTAERLLVWKALSGVT